VVTHLQSFYWQSFSQVHLSICFFSLAVKFLIALSVAFDALLKALVSAQAFLLSSLASFLLSSSSSSSFLVLTPHEKLELLILMANSESSLLVFSSWTCLINKPSSTSGQSRYLWRSLSWTFRWAHILYKWGAWWSWPLSIPSMWVSCIDLARSRVPPK